MQETSEVFLTQDNDGKSQQELLEEIHNAKTQLEEERVAGNSDQYLLTVSLPHGCVINGILTFQTENTDNSVLYINSFQVPSDYQGKGIGKRLLRSLVTCAKTYGAIKVIGNVTSASALKTRARVFGKENLIFYQRGALGDRQDMMKVDYEQVLANSQNLGRNLFVAVDLTQVDTSDWEVPELI